MTITLSKVRVLSRLELRVKEFREKSKMTQGELAKRSNLSRATISRIENQYAEVVNMASLIRIATALGIEVESLFLVK